MVARGLIACLCSIMMTVAAASGLGQQPTFEVDETSTASQEPELKSSTVQSLLQRMEDIEAENAELRQIIERTQVDVVGAATGLDSLTTNPSCSEVKPASYLDPCGCDELGCDGDCNCCPDCGKQVCEGLPHLCGICLDKLSWNKAGGWRVVPFGFLRGEIIYSTANTLGDAVILGVTPDNPGVNDDIATVHAKTSQLNFLLTGPNMGEWQTGGLIVANFLGPAPLRNQSGYNILNAYGEVKNENWRFAFGRMMDLFGPIAPSTVNFLQQRGAGNIGLFRGAMHIDRYLNISDAQRWTLSARAAQQDISDYAGIPQIRGKDNGWPNIEGRIGLELGCERDFGRPVEVGISGVIGEIQAVLDATFGDIIQPAIDEVAQTRGICVDLQLKTERCGISAEAWWGQAGGTYFVATLQSLNPQTDQAIESIGGWLEAYYIVNPCITTRIGYGVDDPRNGDLGFLNPRAGPGQISYNDVAWWNISNSITKSFEMGFELSHRQTRYLANNTKNEGTGFHFYSALKY